MSRIADPPVLLPKLEEASEREQRGEGREVQESKTINKGKAKPALYVGVPPWVPMPMLQRCFFYFLLNKHLA